jgi:hypothetical protein
MARVRIISPLSFSPSSLTLCLSQLSTPAQSGCSPLLLTGCLCACGIPTAHQRAGPWRPLQEGGGGVRGAPIAPACNCSDMGCSRSIRILAAKPHTYCHIKMKPDCQASLTTSSLPAALLLIPCHVTMGRDSTWDRPCLWEVKSK